MTSFDPPSYQPGDREYDEDEPPVKDRLDSGDFGPGLVEREEQMDEGRLIFFGEPRACPLPPRIDGEVVLKWVRGETGEPELREEVRMLETRGWRGHQ